MWRREKISLKDLFKTQKFVSVVLSKTFGGQDLVFSSVLDSSTHDGLYENDPTDRKITTLSSKSVEAFLWTETVTTD